MDANKKLTTLLNSALNRLDETITDAESPEDTANLLQVKGRAHLSVNSILLEIMEATGGIVPPRPRNRGGCWHGIILGDSEQLLRDSK